MSIFRKEAVDHNAGHERAGDLVRISPAWIHWSYRLLVGVVIVGLIYAWVGTVHEYARGPAVIRVDGRADVTARTSGTVAAVAVSPGQRVSAGELLVRFYGAEEAAELDRLRQEFDDTLAKTLRDPQDTGARQALSSLRAQKELQERRITERSLRAPQDGVVSDIRIRPGQRLEPGDVLLSIVGDGAQLSVVVMLPGKSRPLLRPGGALRLELHGFKYAYRDLVIESIGDEVVGPAEVKRFLGDDIADAVPVSGPVVLVRARLPSATFVTEGQELQYYDGMLGTAEVRVRTETVLYTLIPGLRGVFGGGD